MKRLPTNRAFSAAENLRELEDMPKACLILFIADAKVESHSGRLRMRNE